jgi:hypothetical protein
MGTDAPGKFLFVTNFFPSSVTVFSIASNGSLSLVTGSPFPTGRGGGLESLTAFPGKSCVPNQILVDYFANANTPGAPDATVRVINPGTSDAVSVASPTRKAGSTGGGGEDLCALIYVIDANQELSECCGCYISANGLLTRRSTTT